MSAEMSDQVQERHGLIQPYDIIGDIHGYADVLEELLRKLGYERTADTWQHPGGRKAVFLGDYIDRGPSIRRTLQIVRGMVEKGEASAIMGNHEYNALLYHASDGKGGWLRPHVSKNVGQHAVTLAQFWNHRDEWHDYLAWFARLPLWLDLGDFRAVHASWNERLIIERLDCRVLGFDSLRRSATKGTAEYVLCDTLLKGPEIELPPGYNFTDKESTVRTKMRLQWWRAARGRTYHELCMPQSDIVPHLPLPQAVESLCPGYSPAEPPVFFGHYWLPFHGAVSPIAPNMACLDFSVAKNGALVAYCWDGEQTLEPDKLVYVKEQK
jgi:hypothetical protein